MRNAWLIACSALALLACDKDAKSPQGLPDGDPALACRTVREGGLLVDVRSPEEFSSGHPDRAVNVPIGTLDETLEPIHDLTKSDKSTPIVVYCQSGRRSARAKEALLEAGYRRVTNLGGVDDWPDDCPGP